MFRQLRRLWENYTASIPKSEVVDSVPESQWDRADLVPRVSAATRRAFTDLLVLIYSHLPPDEVQVLVTRGTKALARADEVDSALSSALLLREEGGPQDNTGFIACDWKATEEVQWQADRLCRAHQIAGTWKAPPRDMQTMLASLDTWLKQHGRRLLCFSPGDSVVAFAVRSDQTVMAAALGKKLKVAFSHPGET